MIINSGPKPEIVKSNNGLGNVKREEVLEIIRSNGPSTATQIRKDIKAETYLISAVLSELVNLKELKTTNVKKGTAIFYYLPGQEVHLEKLISFLNEKDQGTVKFLKEKKVLEDKSQELFTRVSLRKIPDYAKAINIRISETELKIFWKYFLVSDEEAKENIRKILSPIYNKKEKPKKIETPKVEEKIIVKEKIEHIVEEKTQINDVQQNLINENSQIEEKLHNDKEFIRINQKLNSENIIIKEAKFVRKNKEFDLIIIMNTPIGKTKFFAKYKNKKRCNDADVSTAIVLGQSKQLPVAFITSGELTKKTKEQKDKLFHNVMIVEGF